MKLIGKYLQQLALPKASSAIIITGTTGIEWDAEVVEGNTWCAFSSKDYTNSTKSGVVNSGLNVLYVYYKSNTGKEQREAKISFRFAGGEAQTFTLLQLAESQQNLPPFGAWANFRHLRRMRIINTSHITVH